MQRRSIVRDPLFEDSLLALFPGQTKVADDYTLAAEELLSRDPQMGAQTFGDVWSLAMAPVMDRTVYLFYTFDAREVLFLAIAAMDD